MVKIQVNIKFIDAFCFHFTVESVCVLISDDLRKNNIH